MHITWLGQAGFRLQSNSGVTIYIDPYLSDSLFEKNGESHRRQTPIDDRFLRESIDVLILTHAHGDHTDMGTLDRLFSVNKNIPVLAPRHILSLLRERYQDSEDWMLFEPGTEITIRGIRFAAAFAMHSDPCPIGVIIELDDRTIAHTGDTMYHRQLLSDYPKNLDLLLLPVNGKGNNMNAFDAARLTAALKPRAVFPMHWDMFLSYSCDPKSYTDLIHDLGTEIIQSDPYEEITL